MKININITVSLTEEQVKILTQSAISSGHGAGDTTKPRDLIKKYLTDKVLNAVIYCKEHIDYYDDGRDEN